jgi:hypothetical protein
MERGRDRFGGKMVLGTKNGYRRRRWFRNQIFYFYFFKKMLKLKWPFPRRKGPGRGRQDGPCLSLLIIHREEEFRRKRKARESVTVRGRRREL